MASRKRKARNERTTHQSQIRAEAFTLARAQKRFAKRALRVQAIKDDDDLANAMVRAHAKPPLQLHRESKMPQACTSDV